MSILIFKPVTLCHWPCRPVVALAAAVTVALAAAGTVALAAVAAAVATVALAAVVAATVTSTFAVVALAVVIAAAAVALVITVAAAPLLGGDGGVCLIRGDPRLIRSTEPDALDGAPVHPGRGGEPHGVIRVLG
jgi:hypothetical protein